MTDTTISAGGSPSRLAEIRQREQEATAGPWKFLRDQFNGKKTVGAIGSIDSRDYFVAEIWSDYEATDDDPEGPPSGTAANNAQFIAHAREDIPHLLDELAAADQRREAAEREIAELKKNLLVSQLDRFVEAQESAPSSASGPTGRTPSEYTRHRQMLKAIFVELHKSFPGDCICHDSGMPECLRCQTFGALHEKLWGIVVEPRASGLRPPASVVRCGKCGNDTDIPAAHLSGEASSAPDPLELLRLEAKLRRDEPLSMPEQRWLVFTVTRRGEASAPFTASAETTNVSGIGGPGPMSGMMVTYPELYAPKVAASESQGEGNAERRVGAATDCVSSLAPLPDAAASGEASAPAQDETIRQALQTLVDRLDAVHADPRYQSVWSLYAIQGGNYTEPKYENEFKAAKDALAAAASDGRAPQEDDPSELVSIRKVLAGCVARLKAREDQP